MSVEPRGPTTEELRARVLAQSTDRMCARCAHPESCHGAGGCEVEVRDYGDLDCFCRSFVAPRPARPPLDSEGAELQ